MGNASESHPKQWSLHCRSLWKCHSLSPRLSAPASCVVICSGTYFGLLYRCPFLLPQQVSSGSPHHLKLNFDKWLQTYLVRNLGLIRRNYRNSIYFKRYSVDCSFETTLVCQEAAGHTAGLFTGNRRTMGGEVVMVALPELTELWGALPDDSGFHSPAQAPVQTASSRFLASLSPFSGQGATN